MGPRAEKAADAIVLIMRCGYATDALWQAAIDTALACGRRVEVVTTDGRREPR